MSRLDGIFDPTRRPNYRHLLREAAAAARPLPKLPQDAPRPDGRGQPILVIPGFCTTDAQTRRLRAHLANCNFIPHPAAIGLNIGPTDRILRRLNHRLDTITAEHGPVILIGVSLGGLLARHLAYDRPADIRHVLTLASPFVLPTVSTLGLLVRLCSFRFSKTAPVARLATPLPVPSTMLFTADDGIVAPESCWRTLEGGTVIPLTGAHLTIADDPHIIQTIANHLATLA